jgi:GNAT superfamily N-acetyltransferase
MEYRAASDADLDLLAEWNHQLIRDEGHRNKMDVGQLRERMADFLHTEYRAFLFSRDKEPVAYCLYKEGEEEIYLRQLFVARAHRRQGAGAEAVHLLRNRIWPSHKRVTVQVLSGNATGVAFWKSVGFSDYCLEMELLPAK